MAKQRTYYTLFACDHGGKWGPEFGDYDDDAVYQEKRDRIDSDRYQQEAGKRTRYVIKAHDDNQAAVDRITKLLNGEG